MEERKSRSANFRDTEVRLLMALVKPRLSIIENKKNNRQTLKIKMDVWKDITEQFNKNRPGIMRTQNVLKQKYDNLKKLQRLNGTSQFKQQQQQLLRIAPVKVTMPRAPTKKPPVLANTNKADSATDSIVLKLLDEFVTNLRNRVSSSNNNDAIRNQSTLCETDKMENDIASNGSYEADIEIDQFRDESKSCTDGTCNDDNVSNIDDNEPDWESLMPPLTNANAMTAAKQIKRENGAESNVQKNHDNNMEAMQRILVEKKILLCDLQIELAKKQLKQLKQ